MFEEMVSLLKNAEIVPQQQLRMRFDRAMVKKLGVIKTPYSFWPADKKINPAAKELLWAAILLEDKGDFRLAESIIATEITEKHKASGHYLMTSDVSRYSREATSEYLDEFLDLAPSPDFRSILKMKVDTILAS